MQSFTVSLIQMQATADVEANWKKMERGVAQAAKAGAKLVCGPEMFYFFGASERLAEMAISVPGPVTDRLAALARAHQIFLVPGSVPEKNPQGLPFNTLVFFSPRGQLLGRYCKRHLFWAEIPGALSYDERHFLTAGTEPAPVIDTPLARFGLSICYDLRFPEQYLHLAQAGAEILLIPAAFTWETGKDHWVTLCRSRAIETGCFVLAPNQTGWTQPAPRTYGHSLAIDPWGRVLAEADETEQVVTVSLSAEALAAARSRIRPWAHRAPGDSLPDPQP